jgi:hypothetical protein
VIIQILKDNGKSKFGVDLFWQGDQSSVDGITDPVAKYIAKQVVKEGVPQKRGKWDISIIWEPVIELTEEEANLLPCSELSAIWSAMKRTGCWHMDAKHAVKSHPNYKEDIKCSNCGDWVPPCEVECPWCGVVFPKEYCDG